MHGYYASLTGAVSLGNRPESAQTYPLANRSMHPSQMIGNLSPQPSSQARITASLFPYDRGL